MKTPKEIESLARKMRFEPAVEADRRILSGAQAVLDRRIEVRLSGRWNIKSTLMRLAIAAAVVIAGTRIGTHFFGQIPGVTWAVVLRKVKRFATCVFRTRSVETTGPRPDGFEFSTETETRNYRSEVYGAYCKEYENGKLAVRNYTQLQERQYLFFYEAKLPKSCWRGPFDEEGVQEFQNNDPRRMVAKILAADCEEIGTDVIEGKPVRGVESRDPRVWFGQEPRIPVFADFYARFWIDIETELPVWMEMSFVLEGSPVRRTMIWDQFQWGVPLEAGLFHPEIPPDCRTIEHRPGPALWDLTPKTPTEEAFVRHTLEEPYLSDFDHLPLPDVSGLSLLGANSTAPKPHGRFLGRKEIQVAHDACVAKWPRYEQVRVPLLQELQAKLGIDAMDVNGLVTAGIALRNLFWNLGGCLSERAYPYIYAARLLDELAYEREPENSAVIDQFVESIMTYEVHALWQDPVGGRRTRNPVYTGLLTDLRVGQFGLLKAKVSQGYVPTWKDLVRACDLLWLCVLRKTNEAADREVTHLLIEQASRAGWTCYLDRLQRHEQGQAAPLVTFDEVLSDIHTEQYGRRLWSFQGPEEYRRIRLPAHLRHLKGWQKVTPEESA